LLLRRLIMRPKVVEDNPTTITTYKWAAFLKVATEYLKAERFLLDTLAQEEVTMTIALDGDERRSFAFVTRL